MNTEITVNPIHIQQTQQDLKQEEPIQETLEERYKKLDKYLCNCIWCILCIGVIAGILTILLYTRNK